MKFNNLEDFRGIVCYHEKTKGLMYVKKATVFNEELNFDCKVLTTDDNEKYYYADATYNANEVLLTHHKIQDLLAQQKLREGTQLSLF